MKNIILFILFFSMTDSFSQIMEANETPNVIPPSPTAASFMKFEEIPVSYYTGIPDINIPIFETKLKNGQSFEIKLSYHAANINANTVASDCGLGWSLMAGGSIARTAKGYPDELLKFDSSVTGDGKVGIYQTSLTNYNNKFYEYSDILENNLINSGNMEMINNYLWDVNVEGRYDTEHDLYQYNFMNYTGRFFIKKNSLGLLEVVKLDNNALQIINNYNATTYVPDSFTIIDEYGNKYIFNVKESSRFSNDNFYYDYFSSFHLAEIRDSNDVQLVTFSYASNTEFPMDEGTNLSTRNVNYDKLNVVSQYGNIAQNDGLQTFSPLPPDETHFSQITTMTKKLSVINIIGLSNIYFDFSVGREDTNALLSTHSRKLSQIYIKDWKDVNYRKFQFSYQYSANLHVRMMLNEIKLFDTTDTQESNYLFSYKQKIGYEPIGKDYWGFFTKSTCGNYNWETTPGYSDIDIIQKIKYPEGGSVIFDFESNTYSYESDAAITNFDTNPDNTSIVSQASHDFIPNSNYSYTPYNLNFSATQDQYVDIYPGISYTQNEYKFLYLYKNNDNPPVRGFSCPDECTGCKIRVKLEAGAHYSLKLTISDTNYLSEGLHIDLDYINTSPVKQFLYGGGNRIRKVGYFDKNVDAKYYESYPSYTNQGLPKKEINYNYSEFTNSTKSSGALVYPKPKFSYERSKKECLTLGNNTYSGTEYDIEYITYTETNNLAAIKTKGADVGYKNVTVSETNNGFKRYVFSNSLDFPETISDININYPFLPTSNIDYKRGLLMEEETYDNLGNILKKVINTYTFQNYTENIGINVYSFNNYQFINVRQHNNYTEYKNYLNSHTNCFCCFGEPIDFAKSELHYEAFGWVDTVVTDSYDYFYNNTSQYAVYSNKITTYNTNNYKIANEKVTDAYNNFIETKYFYPVDASMATKPFRNDMLTRNMVGNLLVVEKYRGSNKLFMKETEYGSFPSGNVNHPLLMPKYLHSKKGNVSNNPLVTDVTFDNYDTNGNLTQYTGKNGLKTAIIWGYKKYFPVLKAENCQYSSITPGLITSLQSVTDSPTATQSTIAVNLNNLRSNSLFSNSMVNTYTYNPLQGITWLKDAKEDFTFFEYDAFNRLYLMRDRDGKLLKENEYNYRP